MGIRSSDYGTDELVYEETVTGEPYMPNLHQLLEDIKDTDKHIESLRLKRQKMLEQYYTERDKLDAHHEMVINKPQLATADPGPTTGRY